jgi:hypothetical protein
MEEEEKREREKTVNGDSDRMIKGTTRNNF